MPQDNTSILYFNVKMKRFDLVIGNSWDFQQIFLKSHHGHSPPQKMKIYPISKAAIVVLP